MTFQISGVNFPTNCSWGVRVIKYDIRYISTQTYKQRHAIYTTRILVIIAIYPACNIFIIAPLSGITGPVPVLKMMLMTHRISGQKAL